MLKEKINNLNNNKGIRFLNNEGGKRLEDFVKQYKREHKIHWKKDVSEESWYLDYKKSLFDPELQGTTWNYSKIV